MGSGVHQGPGRTGRKVGILSVKSGYYFGPSMERINLYKRVNIRDNNYGG